jgi:hypothetical protein
LLEGKTTIREKPVSTFSEHKATPDNVPDALGLANLETLDLTIDVLVALDVEAELLDNDFDGEEILPE